MRLDTFPSRANPHSITTLCPSLQTVALLYLLYMYCTSKMMALVSKIHHPTFLTLCYPAFRYYYYLALVPAINRARISWARKMHLRHRIFEHVLALASFRKIRKGYASTSYMFREEIVNVSEISWLRDRIVVASVLKFFPYLRLRPTQLE